MSFYNLIGSKLLLVYDFNSFVYILDKILSIIVDFCVKLLRLMNLIAEKVKFAKEMG